MPGAGGFQFLKHKLVYTVYEKSEPGYYCTDSDPNNEFGTPMEDKKDTLENKSLVCDLDLEARPKHAGVRRPKPALPPKKIARKNGVMGQRLVDEGSRSQQSNLKSQISLIVDCCK